MTSNASTADEQLLSVPMYPDPPSNSDTPSEPLTRTNPPIGNVSTKREAFTVAHRSYKQQYASMYFLRLSVLKDYCINACATKWSNLNIAGQNAKVIDRVLDIRQGELGWVVGTIYMDLPLKPNVLEDLARDHFITVPPPREKYLDENGNVTIMIEDESGRIELSGNRIYREGLVTGCVVGVLGSETTGGQFDVVDVCLPEMPPQPKVDEKMDDDMPNFIAFASGLSISGDFHESLETHLMMEYLTGELLCPEDQKQAARISRLILAGNSLAKPKAPDALPTKKSSDKKKYGYDSSAYTASPTLALDSLLSTICTTIPVSIIPGSHDPTSVALPQQPIHMALFDSAKAYSQSTLESLTNPSWWDIDGIKVFGTSGQNVDDVYKYVDDDHIEGGRIGLLEKMLRWRHVAPTAPDTLWCYPFQDRDPFVLEETPHIFFAGNQPRYDTRLVQGEDGQKVRIINIPKFSETGEIVLVNTSTLEAEVMKFSAGTTAQTDIKESTNGNGEDFMDDIDEL